MCIRLPGTIHIELSTAMGPIIRNQQIDTDWVLTTAHRESQIYASSIAGEEREAVDLATVAGHTAVLGSDREAGAAVILSRDRCKDAQCQHYRNCIEKIRLKKTKLN